MSRALLVLLSCLAFHPVFHWTVLRALDGSDEPWNLLALAFAPCWVWIDRSAAKSAHSSLAALLGVAGYVLFYPLLTPLPRGMLAMTALTGLISPLYLRCRFSVGLWLVLLLALPVVASLQFYAGYPLRVAVAELARVLLRFSGFPVEVKGVALVLGTRTVLVDVPCSGLKMLWVGGFATGALSLLHRLDVKQTLLSALSALVLLFVANVLRATALFHVELGLVELPAWGHQGVGLVLFALTLAAIARAVRWRAEELRRA
jgi:exosortase/archaeosortase family protein